MDSYSRYMAMLISMSAGGAIASDMGDALARDYRSGLSRRDIVNKRHLLDGRYGLTTMECAMTAVYHALRHVMDEDDIAGISEAHINDSGLRAVELGLGIHNPSHDRKRASRKTVSDRGEVPWTREQRRFLRRAYRSPRFQIHEGCHAGHPDYGLIGDAVERRFGVRRARNSMVSMKYKIETGMIGI